MKKNIKVFAVALFFILAFNACKEPEPETKNKPPASGTMFTITINDSQDNGSIAVINAITGNPITRAQVYTRIVVTCNPETGYTADWVKYNNTSADKISLNTFEFYMPNTNVTITGAFKPGGMQNAAGGLIFEDGWHNGAEFGDIEINWGEDGQGVLTGDIELEPGVGMSGGQAIKIDVTKITDYLGVLINFDPINMNSVDGLSMWVKTTHELTGLPTDVYIKPAINEVVFGQYDSEENSWSKKVVYTGELNEGIDLNLAYQQILVPIPKRIGHDMDSIMLYFAPRQVENFVIYVDQISFFTVDTGEKVLESIVLRDDELFTVPYKTHTSGVLETDLDVLSKETKLIYEVLGVKRTLYGKNSNPDTPEFLNIFTDFFNITYSLNSGAPAVISGNKITPSSANHQGLQLRASYDGKQSDNSMTIDILNLPRQQSGGTLTIDDFSNVPVGGDWKFLPPYYWGGWAGDAQSYGDGVIYFYLDNLMVPAVLDIGRVRDDWFSAGSLGLNHDLTGLTKVTVRYKLVEGISYMFALQSGYTGVAQTLEGSDPDGARKSHSIELVGKGFGDFEEHTFNLSEFSANGVDLTCVTGFSLSTDKSLNEGKIIGNDDFFMQVDSIIAHQ